MSTDRKEDQTWNARLGAPSLITVQPAAQHHTAMPSSIMESHRLHSHHEQLESSVALNAVKEILQQEQAPISARLHANFQSAHRTPIASRMMIKAKKKEGLSKANPSAMHHKIAELRASSRRLQGALSEH